MMSKNYHYCICNSKHRTIFAVSFFELTRNKRNTNKPHFLMVADHQSLSDRIQKPNLISLKFYRLLAYCEWVAKVEIAGIISLFFYQIISQKQ